jgi:hypothetical protein
VVAFPGVGRDDATRAEDRRSADHLHGPRR